MTEMPGNRSSPTVSRYGDLDTLGEQSEPQYSEQRERERERMNLERSTCIVLVFSVNYIQQYTDPGT